MSSRHGHREQQTIPSKLEFAGFKTYVKMDGKKLECYALQINKAKIEASCWIASWSEAGKAFSVDLETPSGAVQSDRTLGRRSSDTRRARRAPNALPDLTGTGLDFYIGAAPFFDGYKLGVGLVA
ncbi:hypothetical protein BDZ97DRAFT_1752875 [Flammula alnicola]|nr:hypothetical protein BDZ97DRAFT_1752875 [Flammula alnicola]